MRIRMFDVVLMVAMAMIVYGAPQRQQTEKPPVYRNISGNATELFGYPEDQSVIKSNQNARNRTPVFIPNKCEENEILYPGDQESDWVCDCKPTFVYHPPTRQCYQLFTQAYCEPHQMITLEQGSKQPQCVLNPCYDPNATMVLFNNVCVQLNTYHDSCSHHDVKQLVGVRESDNQLACVNISGVNQQQPLPPRKNGNANRRQSS